MVRVVVADKQSSVRYALNVLLGRQEGMVVVGEADSLEACQQSLLQVTPDILLLDWELPGMKGRSSIEQLREANADLKIIAMSALPGVRFHATAAGVDAFIPKTEPPDRLLLVLKSYETISS